MSKVQWLIRDYELRLSNLKFHLDTNDHLMSEQEKSNLRTRIYAHQQFINDLNKLL